MITIMKYIKDNFETHEYDALFVLLLHHKPIETHVDNVVVATGIWQNVQEFALEHKQQMGIHTWKLFQAITSVLHLPGHHLPTLKLCRITGIPQHHFQKSVSDICKQAATIDRSGTRNPHTFKVEAWALEAMMPSPHSSVSVFFSVVRTHTLFFCR